MRPVAVTNSRAKHAGKYTIATHNLMTTTTTATSTATTTTTTKGRNSFYVLQEVSEPLLSQIITANPVFWRRQVSMNANVTNRVIALLNIFRTTMKTVSYIQ